jgi:hypothetical protein
LLAGRGTGANLNGNPGSEASPACFVSSITARLVLELASSGAFSRGIAPSLLSIETPEILRYVERLRRARDLLAVKGFDTRDTVLTCYSGAGFERELQAGQRRDIRLVGLDRLYAD